ncbi:EscU/YscU/HrcU family type III secretion system export apparatus switch protein [Asaia prunellae]|uniref:EscU/YscU/HrcU family type III secretion system export apparatus switch protein n=1 Tax=Asaia prunellae TaxID=610245 RepID=UPI00046ED963|nr:EscU/YscU/HrcU family type III secretion system export apparatus switch protein [Asaia prunellae]
MAEDGSSEDRTQAPTGRRLAKAREDGNVAQSRETQMLLVLGAFLAVFSIVGASAAVRFVAHMHGLIEHFSTPIDDMASIGLVIRQAMTEGFLLMAPLVLVSLVTVIAFSMFQTQFLFRPQALIPDLTRLSPFNGFKRVFSLRNLIELFKSLMKFLVFGIVLYVIASGTLNVAPEAERWTVRRLTYELISWFTYATLIILLVQAFIAGLDELWTRHSRIQKLRMSHQDIKDETKREDGDPKIKAKRHQIRMRRARHRMIQSVRKATVVITNPTHYAVALSYESSVAAAPRIVAKGTDELAARIREAAQDAKVPVVNSPPLARGLYALPLDTEIPQEFFKPVAAIIAYVIKLKTPRSRA